MQSRKHPVRRLIMAATVAVLALFYFFEDARHSNIFPKCLFLSLTGLVCPGCGSQRAISSLLHGNIMEAIDYNGLLVMTLPLLTYSASVSLTNVFRKEQAIQKIFYSAVIAKTVFAVVVLFGVLRNIPVYPFTILAP